VIAPAIAGFRETGGSAPSELWTAATAADADRYTMDELAVPSLVLMERAALSVAHEVAALRAGTGLPVIVLCGPGNNGGDGLAVARQLHGWEIPVRAILASASANAAAMEQRRIAEATGVTVQPLQTATSGAAIVVDALLGTGSRGAPRGAIVDALRWQQGSSGPRVAIDLPSGLDPDTGSVAELAFTADLTVTFVRSKPGLHVTPGRARAGRVIVADIGLHGRPDRDRTHALVEPAFAQLVLARLPAGHHKGERGHLGIVGGSAGTPGAAVLAGTAAMRAGVGLCTIATDDPVVQAQLVAHRPELMVVPRGGERPAPRADALVVGPGLTDPAAQTGLGALWQGDSRPALWDASALDHVPFGAPCRASRVITPHPGEAARMLARAEPAAGWTGAKVQAERLHAAAALASRTGAVTVLKGEGTIVAHPAGRLAINVTGAPTLATAGSGDVLSGLGGALLARGVGAWEAACIAAYVHGLCGEALASRGGGPMAMDVAEAIGDVIEAARAGTDPASWPRWRR
jgi:hydroxyethylthiazole kinase-like uncharacterized protein yjeF